MCFSKFNINFAIAHNSGTSTLHSCLAALGVGYGDEVIVPRGGDTILPGDTVIAFALASVVDDLGGMFSGKK